MQCVVTGAAGFIGSSIVDRLLKEGHEVLGVDCFTDYYSRQFKERNLAAANDHQNFKFVEGDLLELDLPDLLSNCQWLFHQAAQAGVRGSWGDDFSIYTNNNVLCTQRLLEAARSEKVKEVLESFVYASSSSVYGTAETFPTNEQTLPRPVSPYGVSKLAAEQLAVLYAEEFAVPTVSLRYFTVYGPRQRPDMAFHKFIRAGLTGEAIEIYGDGEQSRDFTFIDDAVEANLAAANADVPGLVCNIGGGSRVTLNEVLVTIEETIGHSMKLQYLDRQAGEDRHTSADTTVAKESLGFSPQTSLEKGIAAEVKWLSSIV